MDEITPLQIPGEIVSDPLARQLLEGDLLGLEGDEQLPCHGAIQRDDLPIRGLRLNVGPDLLVRPLPVTALRDPLHVRLPEQQVEVEQSPRKPRVVQGVEELQRARVVIEVIAREPLREGIGVGLTELGTPFQLGEQRRPSRPRDSRRP